MLQQLGLLKLSKTEKKIAEQIIGSLDEDGYLRREIESIIDDLAFRQNIESTEEEIRSIIEQIQQFDPPGVAAKDLRECLILQLKRKQENGTDVKLSLQVMENYFEEFTKKHYEKIQRNLHLDDDQLRGVISQIVKLNPKPGILAGESTATENYILPDFFIFNNAGKLELSLNSKNAPD